MKLFKDYLTESETQEISSAPEKAVATAKKHGWVLKHFYFNEDGNFECECRVDHHGRFDMFANGAALLSPAKVKEITFFVKAGENQKLDPSEFKEYAEFVKETNDLVNELLSFKKQDLPVIKFDPRKGATKLA